MMAGGGNQQQQQTKKKQFLDKLKMLFAEYPKFFIVGADNVGSHLLQRIRCGLRGQAVIQMGKNTMIRKALLELIETNPIYECILPLVKGNVGFVFTNGDLRHVYTKLVEHRVGAPAKAGIIAPNDVIVTKGPTGMEPTQTSFLQALNIPSKINRGQIEIVNDVALIKKGQIVGSSEATLLAKLNIKPFSYGLQVLHMYDDGHVCDPYVLRGIEDIDLLAKFTEGLNTVASLSLSIGYPTLASLPHALSHAYKNVLSVVMETSYTFPAAMQIKDFIDHGPHVVNTTVVMEEEKVVVIEKEGDRCCDDCDCHMFGYGSLFDND